MIFSVRLNVNKYCLHFKTADPSVCSKMHRSLARQDKSTANVCLVIPIQTVAQPCISPSNLYELSKKRPNQQPDRDLATQSFSNVGNSLFFIVFYPCNILIIYLYSNKLHSTDIFYKQHIKIFVLSKTLKTSPTCFDHYLTIIREILYLS